MHVKGLSWLFHPCPALNQSVSTTPGPPLTTTSSTSLQIWTWNDWSGVSTGFILLIRATSSDLTLTQLVQLNLLKLTWPSDFKHSDPYKTLTDCRHYLARTTTPSSSYAHTDSLSTREKNADSCFSQVVFLYCSVWCDEVWKCNVNDRLPASVHLIPWLSSHEFFMAINNL